MSGVPNEVYGEYLIGKTSSPSTECFCTSAGFAAPSSAVPVFVLKREDAKVMEQ